MASFFCQDHKWPHGEVSIAHGIGENVRFEQVLLFEGVGGLRLELAGRHAGGLKLGDCLVAAYYGFAKGD
jgi:hypothetical protein